MRARERDRHGQAAQLEAARIVEDAKTKTDCSIKEAELKAKDLVVDARAEAERELRERRRDFTALETKLRSARGDPREAVGSV